MDQILLNRINSTPWMIHPDHEHACAILLANMVQGNSMEAHDKVLKPYAINRNSTANWFDFRNAPEGSIMVHPIKGIILKHSTYDGTVGTIAMMQLMREADKMDNIKAHILEIDSPGGEGTNIETFARFIRNEIKKPVIAWFNGLCASAALYIAAAADEVYASQKADRIGSLGTYVSFTDLDGYLEDLGIKVHRVYAAQSTLKHADVKAAKEGDYKPLQENFLNEFAEQFIQTVKDFRPNLTEEDAYKGKVYQAQKALEIGMIDGILTFNAAIDRASALSPTIINQPAQNTNMFDKIQALLGIKIKAESGRVTLTEEDLERLNAALADADQLSALSTTVNAQEQTIQQQAQTITGLETQLSAVETKLDDHIQAFEAFKKEDGDTETRATSNTDSQSRSDEDYSEVSQEIDQIATSGEMIRFTK
ncbi:MAG: S49 family peptidase [Bacteroidota bacterium]